MKKRILYFFTALLCCLAGPGNPAAAQGLQAGAAEAVITPPQGTYLAGYGNKDQS